MKILIISLLVLGVVSAYIDEEEDARRALQNPDLFLGDILEFHSADRTGARDEARRWPNRIIPYVIDNSLKSSTDLILKAMNEYQTRTCIRFVPRTDQKNYVKLFSGKGCYSTVGMSGFGEQPISLGPDCLFIGTILHELGHTVGFWHEQNRYDRDEHLNINWHNIIKGMEGQFTLLTPKENILINKFDYESIMIYGNYAFAKDKALKTMVAKNKHPLNEPYTKNALTASDVERVKTLYKC